MDNDQDIVTAFVHDPKRKLLLVSHDGNGFIVPEEEVVANTRKGKQVMNVKAPDEAKRCVPVTGDHLAIVGENRKMLVFPLSEIPEMARGKGVRLQKYKDGGVLDLKPFAMETGLSWQDSADRTFTEVARGTGRMDRRPRIRRPHGAEGFPADGQVRVARSHALVGEVSPKATEGVARRTQRLTSLERPRVRSALSAAVHLSHDGEIGRVVQPFGVSSRLLHYISA